MNYYKNATVAMGRVISLVKQETPDLNELGDLLAFLGHDNIRKPIKRKNNTSTTLLHIACRHSNNPYVFMHILAYIGLIDDDVNTIDDVAPIYILLERKVQDKNSERILNLMIDHDCCILTAIKSVILDNYKKVNISGFHLMFRNNSITDETCKRIMLVSPFVPIFITEGVLNYVDEFGVTALEYIYRHRSLEFIRWFRATYPYQQVTPGYRIYKAAFMCNTNLDVVTELYNELDECIRANVIKYNISNTIIGICCHQKSPDIVRFLLTNFLQRIASFENQRIPGIFMMNSIYHWCVLQRNTEILDIIAEKLGTNRLTIQDPCFINDTVLHLLCRNPKLDKNVFLWFVRHGAMSLIDVTNNQGLRPIDMPYGFRCTNIINNKLLLLKKNKNDEDKIEILDMPTDIIRVIFNMAELI